MAYYIFVTLYAGAGKMVIKGGVDEQPYVVSLLVVDTKLWTGLSNGSLCIYNSVRCVQCAWVVVVFI